jgi:hypothetical protein
VGYKEIRKRALQDDNSDTLISLEFPAQHIEFRRQHFIKKVDWRVIDADECDSGLEREPKTFVVGVKWTPFVGPGEL